MVVELKLEDLVKELRGESKYSDEVLLALAEYDKLKGNEEEQAKLKSTLEEVYDQRLDFVQEGLLNEHAFSRKSIGFLSDKGLGLEQFRMIYDAENLPDQTFEERRKEKSRLDLILDKGDSEEITTGRYNRLVPGFKDISSEQALVQGRMKFAIEYVISLADTIAGEQSAVPDCPLVERAFTDDEKARLRNIYEGFRTKDYLAVKAIERKTNHDIVAANTWVTIRAQQEGLDDDLMRRITHFARTSADVNTNVTGELYTKALGQWTKSVIKLLGELEKRGKEYRELTCIAQTHGQDAQLTTVGHLYANLAEQIKLDLEPMLQDEVLKLDGKIAGAIGTDVDMVAAFSDVDFQPMYRDIVENVFGLNYVRLGNDQDCSNAALCRALDTMTNVGYDIEKAATDTWIYASRGILAKKTKKGESGSSAMPQKANPFFAEGAEALVEIFSNMINPIKKLVKTYRGQGDLRRSITKREGFHPVMLATIATERLIGETKKYDPNVMEIENEMYVSGAKVISSAINTYLRAKGVPDAYDTIKEVVMNPFVRSAEVNEYIDGMVTEGKINGDTAEEVRGMLHSVMEAHDYLEQIKRGCKPDWQQEMLKRLEVYNKGDARKKLVGHAVENTDEMVVNIQDTVQRLERYVA